MVVLTDIGVIQPRYLTGLQAAVVALSKFFPPLVLEIQLKLSFILLMLGFVNILVPERVDGDRETLLRILGLLPLPESGNFEWRIRFKTLC